MNKTKEINLNPIFLLLIYVLSQKKCNKNICDNNNILNILWFIEKFLGQFENEYLINTVKKYLKSYETNSIKYNQEINILIDFINNNIFKIKEKK